MKLAGAGLAAGWPMPYRLSGVPPSQPLPPYGVEFVDIAKQAGLNHTVYYGGAEKVNYIVEANGCGVAFYDYDNDGWLDIFVLNGTRLEGFPVGKEPTNHLYKNNRDGTFTDVTEEAGLVRTGWANSVCIGDFDNDGNDDLFVTYWDKTFSTTTTVTARSPTSPRTPAWAACPAAGTRERLSSTTTGMATSICLSRITSRSISINSRFRGREATATGKGCPFIAVRAA